MIRINRTAPAPSVLSTSRAKGRYSHAAVVQALLLVQHKKCCYCEAYIADSGSGKQVEHFRPRSQFPDLKYEWNNLFLTCADCNSAKSNQFPVSVAGEPLLLDPSHPTVDPEDHIDFVVRAEPAASLANKSSVEPPLAKPRRNSLKGRETIRVVKLSAEHHVKKRGEILGKLVHWYAALRTESNRTSKGNGDPIQVDKWKNELREAMGDDRAYAGLARTFVREYQVSL